MSKESTVVLRVGRTLAFMLIGLLDCVFLRPLDSRLSRLALSLVQEVGVFLEDELGIHEGVSQDNLIKAPLDALLRARDRVPSLRSLWKALFAPAHLPLLQLLQEGASQLEVGPA